MDRWHEVRSGLIGRHPIAHEDDDMLIVAAGGVLVFCFGVRGRAGDWLLLLVPVGAAPALSPERALQLGAGLEVGALTLHGGEYVLRASLPLASAPALVDATLAALAGEAAAVAAELGPPPVAEAFLHYGA